MNWRCSKKHCEKCRKYRDKYLKQESKNDELIEMIESLLETQKKIIEYLDQEKVVRVNIKNITSKSQKKED